MITPRTATDLALFGGKLAVDIPPPHFRWPVITQEEEEAVLTQLRSGPLSFGRRSGVIEQFESEFADFHKMPYAISTHCGTGALHAAFFGLGLKHGDEVLAPAYAHIATVQPMVHVGLIPVLCDVDENTGNIDPADAERRISSRTRAIVVIHQYGHVADMDAIHAMSRRHGLRIIEDASHAHGATYNGALAGTLGDVAAFSLQSHKVITAGEGGVLLTRHPEIAARAALFAHFREATLDAPEEYLPFFETGYGLKNRLHPLGAALVLAQFRKLPEKIAQRRENREYFEERLNGIAGVRPLPTSPNVTRGGSFRFLVKYDPDELNGLPIDEYIRALKAEGVAEVLPGSIAKPLHLTRFFQTLEDGMYPGGWPRRGPHALRELVYRPGDFPKAERFSSLTLQFPAFTDPSEPIIDAYCRAMEKVEWGVEHLLAYLRNVRAGVKP